MKYVTTAYLYLTWHASIFDCFCGILPAGRVNFRTFSGVAHHLEELKKIAFEWCIMHISEIQIMKISRY